MPRIRAASIDQHKALTRRALLDSARELIRVTGTVDIPLADIALSAGVGRTTFYDYFSDRDDVVAALVEEEVPQVLAELIASVDPGLPTTERLGELAGKMVEYVANDPVHGTILHREIGRMGGQAQERIALSHQQLSVELMGLYRRGVEEGVFRAIPPRLAGMLIQDTIMSGARLLIVDEDARRDVEGVTAGVRAFLLAGLGTGEGVGR